MDFLKKHYDLSFGKLVGVVALWIVFSILIYVPNYILTGIVTALAA